MSCNICTENFTKKIRVPIVCGFCDFEACRKCCETFILTQPETKCMNPTCNKVWTRSFLNKNFSQTFVSNTLQEHSNRIRYEKELALMPATQPLVERIIEKNKLTEERSKYDEEYKYFKAKDNNIRSVIQSLCTVNGLSSQNAEFLTYSERKANEAIIERLWGEQRKFKKEVVRIVPILEELEVRLQNVDKKAYTKKEFIRRCGDSTCRGFLSKTWSCGICEKSTCKECHLVKDVDHECNQDDVATAKLISQDSKACPKCATFIFKIDGCDQMWCTQCHTAFSWRTGQIEARIHNPHYFEWMRINGTLQRNPNEIQCGRELDQHLINSINSLLRTPIRNKKVTLDINSHITNCCRSTIHLQEIDIPRFTVDNVLNNEKLRIEFMMQLIDEKKFISLLQRDNTKFEKKREIHDILTMFSQSMIDIIFRIHHEAILPTVTNATLNPMLEEIARLIEFTNQNLDHVASDFNSVPFTLNQCMFSSVTAFDKVLIYKK